MNTIIQRPTGEVVQAAILAAVKRIVSDFGCDLHRDEMSWRDWASLTLTGQRHELRLIVSNGDKYAAISELVQNLYHEPISIPGAMVAESIAEHGDGKGEVTISALVIYD